MIRCLFMMTLILLSLFTHVVADELPAQKSADDDRQKVSVSIDQCEKIKSYIVKNKFEVLCNSQYIYYGSNPSSFKPIAKAQLKIANYNLLHPGTSKALYKDYALLAKIANSFDVVAAEEVLSLVARDAAVNQTIDNFIASSTDVEAVKNAKNIYRAPGYLKLLTELKKIDPSWALILSPRGDAALQGSVEEYVGFYFRTSLVKLKTNPYCQSQSPANAKNIAYACMLNFGQKNKYVSRRPFISTFKADNFQFSLVASHVIYNFSGTDDQLSELVKDVFGKNSIAEVGGGVNIVNFARFAEVKLTLEFIKKYIDTYGDKKVIYSADTNLTPELEYWKELLKINDGSELLITDPTTISPLKFNKSNEETNGVANSYDHFVINRTVFNTCDTGHVYNYYNSPIQKDIENTYIIRDLKESKDKSLHLYKNDFEFDKDEDVPPIDDGTTTKLDYPLTKAGEARMNKALENYRAYLQSLKTIKNNAIAVDDFQVEERIDGLKNRIFLKQLTNSFYYRFYQEILSDHFPAYISCKI